MINKKGRFRIFFALIFILAFIFWAFWFVFSESAIINIIEETAEEHFIKVEFKGFKKGLFYNLFVDEIIIKSGQTEIITLNNVRSRINPFKLVINNLDIKFEADSNNGKIRGFTSLAKKNANGKFEFEGMDLTAISLLRKTKIKCSGNISGFFIFNDMDSHIEFISKNLSLEDIEISGIRAPISLFHSMSGAININNNIINIKSISFDGKNVYARLKGCIKDYVADAIIEIMPDKNFLESTYILAGLEKYKVSPGYYLIPLKGEVHI